MKTTDPLLSTSTSRLPQIRTFPSISDETTRSTLESPLLSLPPEIRENIWRLVLGVEGELIHLYRHEYREEEQHFPPLQLDAIPGKKFSLKPSCCRKKQEWDDAYSLSKLPENFTPETRDRRGQLKQDGKGVLISYNARHRHCRRPDIDCQEDGKHTIQCRCSQAALNVDCICAEEDRLDLSLLRVCRSIYFEAAHLPYKLNTFSFPNETNLAYFAKKILTPWQRNIIQRIEVVSEPPIARGHALEKVTASDDPFRPRKPTDEELDMQDLRFEEGLESSLKLFRGLRELKLSIPFVTDSAMAKLRMPDADHQESLKLPTIPTVQVIVGSDTNTFPEDDTGSREERRDLAAAVESLLRGDSCCAHDRSLAKWRYLLSNGRAVSCND